MKTDTNQNEEIVSKEVCSGVLLETPEGNAIGICMRDNIFEINILPKDGVEHWYRVNMEKGEITLMTSRPLPPHINYQTGSSAWADMLRRRQKAAGIK